MSLLVAEWVLLGNLTVKVAEYAVRQHYIDELPPYGPVSPQDPILEGFLTTLHL